MEHVYDEIGQTSKWQWKNEVWNGVKIQRKRFNIEWDWKFFAILPALNVNIHSLELEFGWLFLGIYWNFWKKKEEIYMDVEPKKFV